MNIDAYYGMIVRKRDLSELSVWRKEACHTSMAVKVYYWKVGDVSKTLVDEHQFIAAQPKESVPFFSWGSW